MKIVHKDKVVFTQRIQDLFKNAKSIKVIHHINRIMEKSHIITSNEAEKMF